MGLAYPCLLPYEQSCAFVDKTDKKRVFMQNDAGHNPLRVKIVNKAEDYPHSSAKAHIHGVKDEILGEALFEGRQREDYIELMKASIKEEEINSIRNHTKNGRPMGSESFIEKMERKLDRIFKSKPRGRPKKGERQ